MVSILRESKANRCFLEQNSGSEGKLRDLFFFSPKVSLQALFSLCIVHYFIAMLKSHLLARNNMKWVETLKILLKLALRNCGENPGFSAWILAHVPLFKAAQGKSFICHVPDFLSWSKPPIQFRSCRPKAMGHNLKIGVLGEYLFWISYSMNSSKNLCTLKVILKTWKKNLLVPEWWKLDTANVMQHFRELFINYFRIWKWGKR